MNPVLSLRPRGLLKSSVAAVALGAGIFAVDTLTTLDTAVAVLYSAVILLLADSLGPRGLLVAGAACVGLTVAGFLAVHGLALDPQAMMRGGVSLTAIGLTTVLAVRNRRSAASLQEQAALLNLTHDAILVRDTADTILYWNRGAEALYGWPAREAVGRNAGELLGTVLPAGRAEVTAQLYRAARWDGELRQRCRDGTEIRVSSRWSLQRDAAGRPVATMETNNDITRRRLSEEKLLKAQQELEQVSRVATFSQLTASVAHEVSQPLAAIITNGEACLRWLGRPVPDIGEATGSVERMIAAGRRAGAVVARIRALARRDAPRHERLALNGVIAGAAQLLAADIAARRVVLHLRLAPVLADIRGDRIQLQQVFINLMMNALQAMEAGPLEDAPAGGRVLVVASAPHDDGCGGAPGVAVTVSDTGPGVPAERLPRLFEPFYTSRPGGMGLGLAICASIVEAHGGGIAARPIPDGGMAFHVTLPAMKDMQE
ncbi:ATP-binding protein [Pseudoxanthobacter sp.]|uniref:two-component system sensor histidine kinase NtrB n=1 Tax=Pseudoxanthobacter sp. TaxID=1925742 RepID=UPI002FDF67BF